MKITNWLRNKFKVITLAAFTLIASQCMVAQNVLYYNDQNLGTDQMAIALTNLGYTVTSTTSDVTFQTQIAIPGAYQIAIYLAQNFAANGTSAAALATFMNNGGNTIYWDFAGQSSLSNPLGASFTGSNNQNSVTAFALVSSGLPSNPFTLTNTGWGIFSTGLNTGPGSTVLATFGNGDAAAVQNGNGRSIVLGFASDVAPWPDFFENLLLAFPPPITLTTSALSASVFCPGAPLSVNYTSSGGSFNAGNVFTAQLSNAAGSFASPTTIGTLTSTATSGTISAVVPANTPGGTGYRVRVVSSNPAVTGSDNGSNFTIQPQPVGNFTVSNPCRNAVTQFTNTSTISSGSITSYEYDFGDGSTSLISSPTYSYVNGGTYTVTLYTISNEGCRDTVTQTVTINDRPVAGFSNVPFVCEDQQITFNNVSSGATTYSWDFGDGNTGTATNPTQTYVSPGNYTVTLIATNAAGCSDTAIQSTTALPLPTPDFVATSACPGANVAFTNLSNDNGTGPLTYAWNFGDGNTSSASNPTHAYANAGTYNVTLIAISPSGCRDTIIKPVTVNARPSVVFSATTACQGNATQFSSAATTGAVSYLWRFGDGNISTTPNPSYTYAASGSYTVRLIATSANGCIDSVSQLIVVNPTPVAAFTSSASTICNNGTAVNFTFTGTATANPIYSWTFGDGGTASTANASRTYAAPGTYTVTLIVRDNITNCSDTATSTVTVYPQPTAAFTNTTVCLGQPTQFTNGSTISTGTLSYSWAFGDATTSTDINPSHVYATSGNFNASVTVTSDNGCTATATRSVAVNAVPTANFTVGNNCLGLATSFTNTSSGATSYLWDFGDNNTSTATSPSNTYANAGTYTVTLVATNASGCRDTVQGNVVIYPDPTADFIASNACEDVAIAFTNNSSISGGTLTYSWAFGDGGTSTATNPSYTYVNAGTYNVTLTATSNFGCTSTIVKPITAYGKPTVAYTATTVCEGTNTVFTNNSTVSSGSLNYQWSFGDGTFSNNPAPQHLYATAGTYNVKLIATSSFGCIDSLSTFVTVNGAPTANFTAPAVCYGQSTLFSNSTTGGNSYVWSFGDGNTSTTTSPTYTYAAPGTYQVTLIATTVNGCNDTITKPVTVNPLPVADFNFTSACPNSPVQFNNLSSIIGGTLTYSWNFGDGNTSTAVNPSNTYALQGNYTVSLTVTSNNGCTATVSKTVTVYDTPVAGFTTSDECDGTPLSFTNTSSIASGNMNFVWTFGDGAGSTNINPSHLYAGPGVYTVTLIAISNNSCRDTVSASVEVYTTPTAGFTASAATVCLGDTINFSNTSLNATDYAWSFGDGGSSTNTNVSYLYATPGTYTVTLIATNNPNGCADTAVITITVNPEPVADFTATTVCLGNATQFTDLSTISMGTLSYVWDFGDGNTSTNINPAHTYAGPGIYTVILQVTSNFGCIDSVNYTVEVYEQPISVFSTPDSSLCDGEAFAFTNSSTGSANVTYTWSFGDGNTSTDFAPTYTYAAPGTYTVWLAATDAITGCTDTSSFTVIVFDRPVAGFTSTDVCIGTAVQFTNTSTLAVGTSNYVWNFGDSTTSTNINPSHIYSSIGIKTVTLFVTSNNGCSDTVSGTLIVYPEPVADFSAGPACFGNAVQFSNLTNIPFGTTTYQWAFGDGATSTDENPSHTYPALGVYNVTLTATSNAGCTDQIVYSVTVNPNPNANFIAGNACENSPIDFTNLSTASSGNFTSAWSFGDGNSSLDQEPSHAYTTAGNYSVTLIITSDQGCMDTISRTVTVYATPSVVFAAPDVCIGETTQFTNQSVVANGTIDEIFWDFGDGVVSTLSNPSHQYANPGTYLVKLTITSNQGCVDSVVNVVVVHDLPEAFVRALGPASFCTGDSVELSAGIGGQEAYLWSTGETTQNIIVKETDTYSVTVTSQYGCVDSGSIDITKFAIPNADAGTDTTISKGFSVVLLGSGGVSYSWTPTESLNAPNYQYPVATPLVTTTYILAVIDSNGCPGTDSVTVTVLNDYLIIPTNTLTPNGDGKNDTWWLTNIETYPDAEVLIFDRWGSEVYRSQAYQNDWDGTNDGKELPEGTYYYVVRFSGTDLIYKGAVSILR